MPRNAKLRWSRVALHVVLTVVLTSVVMGIVWTVVDIDSFGLGKMMGGLLVPMVLGAVGVAWLAQTGRRVAAAVLLLAVLIAMPLLELRDMAPPLSASDLVRADATLRHPVLGFAIPDPGSNLTARPQAAAAEWSRDARVWVYSDDESGEAVQIMVVARMAADAHRFDKFFSGVIARQTEAIRAAALTADEQERSLRWDDRRAHAYLIVAETIHLRVDVFGLPGGAALVLVSSARQAQRFAELASGVEFNVSQPM